MKKTIVMISFLSVLLITFSSGQEFPSSKPSNRNIIFMDVSESMKGFLNGTYVNFVRQLEAELLLLGISPQDLERQTVGVSLETLSLIHI